MPSSPLTRANTFMRSATTDRGSHAGVDSSTAPAASAAAALDPTIMVLLSEVERVPRAWYRTGPAAYTGAHRRGPVTSRWACRMHGCFTARFAVGAGGTWSDADAEVDADVDLDGSASGRIAGAAETDGRHRVGAIRSVGCAVHLRDRC